MIDDLYKPCECCGGAVQIMNVGKKEWGGIIDPEFERVLSAIKSGTFQGDIDPSMIKAISRRLYESAESSMQEYYKGTGTNFNPELAAKLECNTYQFAAAKNHKQMALLKSMKAMGVPGDELQAKAAAQHAKFNHTWLQTEENYAKGAAQSAARWNNFDKESWLKYRTSNDERVRNDHRLLNGITKPINDPFWDTYYPPNGYNCRCGAVETSSRAETDMNGRDLPEMDKFFENNIGKQEALFPGNHPYFKGVPDRVMKEADKIYMRSIANNLLNPHCSYPSITY